MCRMRTNDVPLLKHGDKTSTLNIYDKYFHIYTPAAEIDDILFYASFFSDNHSKMNSANRIPLCTNETNAIYRNAYLDPNTNIVLVSWNFVQGPNQKKNRYIRLELCFLLFGDTEYSHSALDKPQHRKAITEVLKIYPSHWTNTALNTITTVT